MEDLDILLEGGLLPALAPIVALLALLIAWLSWRLSGIPAKKHLQKMAALKAAYHRENNPRRKHQLMMEWNEMGGHKYGRQELERREDTGMGQRARAEGLPLSANPFRHSLWGRGRNWSKGWRAVDRNIRWIHQHREPS